MTTRRQILLFVMPLFLCLAGLGSTLAAFIQLRATSRDFDTEARTIATAVCDFLPVVGYGVGSTSTEDTEHNLRTVFDRMRRWGQIERIFVIDRNGTVVVDTEDSGRPTCVDTTVVPAPGVVELQKIQKNTHDQIVRPVIASSEISSWRVGVEVTAKQFKTRRAIIIARSIEIAVWTVIVGLIVTLILARLVSNEFKRLGAAAGSIGSDEFATGAGGARIKEVADVTGILEIMHSVLQETLTKTRRSIVDREFVRNDKSLAIAFEAENRIPETFDLPGMHGALVNAGNPVVMNGTIALPNGGIVFAGLLAEHEGLAKAMHTRAAARFFSGSVQEKGVEAAMEETVATFALELLLVARWESGSLVCWRHDGKTAKVEYEGRPSAKQPILLSGLDPADTDHLAVFRRTRPKHGFEELLRDLPGLLRGQNPGVLLLLQP